MQRATPRQNRSAKTPKRRRTNPRDGAETSKRDDRRSEIEDRLDAGLEETFPASDPVAVDSRCD
jgi:hypothetical protein